MNSNISSLLSIVLICGLVAFSAAKDEIKAGETKPAAPAPAPAAPKTAPVVPLKCYQCNSATENQEECSSHDPEVLAKFIKPCPPLPKGSTLNSTSAQQCRKIEQSVGDEPTRIIRECAYVAGEEIDGKKRTGNKGIISYFYTCNPDVDGTTPCNPAVSYTANGGSSLFAAALFVFAAKFLA